MSNLDKVLKYLGILWSALAFVGAISFFFGGQWETWTKLRDGYKDQKIVFKSDLTAFANKADVPTIQDVSNVIRYDDPIVIHSKQSPGRVLRHSSSYGVETGVIGAGIDRYHVWVLGKSE